MLKDAVKNGVDLVTGVNVNGVERTAEGVKVTGNGDAYEGTFVIGADGINSCVANLMGFNKERKFYGTGSTLSYYITGIKIPQSEACITSIYFKPDVLLSRSFFVLPSPYAEDEYWLSAITQEDFEYVTKESVFSDWFPDVKVRKVQSAIMSLWSPVSEPYKDNVLLVGDSAWFGEAEITGSIMCGWKAANSVTVALKDNMPDREGVLNYIEWWIKSYPEFEDYRDFMMLSPFRLIFSEKELIYLFGLFKSPLQSSFSPFKIVKLVKQALEPIMPQIKEEMPSVFEKLKMLKVDDIDKILLNIKNKRSP